MSAIFKRDFRSYFTSPVGYVYIGAFILVMNVYFYVINVLYSSPYLSGAFSFMMLVMMFTTPVLTMRTFSEELRQKTDQLLLTSPVKLTSIVMGKFFAAFAVFCTVLALTLVWVLIISIFGQPNAAEVIGNYVGILAVSAVYISIGLFISSLTENQIVSALGSLGVFILLYLIDVTLQFFDHALPAWIASGLGFLSIFGRYSAISIGVFSIADIVFFISFAAVFLFLTVRVLEKKRWS